MDEKYIGGQKASMDAPLKTDTKPSLLHTIVENVFSVFSLIMFLSFPLFIIGKVLGADQRSLALIAL